MNPELADFFKRTPGAGSGKKFPAMQGLYTGNRSAMPGKSREFRLGVSGMRFALSFGGR
jgi:hypothetical protein